MMMNEMMCVALKIGPHTVQCIALLELLDASYSIWSHNACMHTSHTVHRVVMTHLRAPSVLTKWMQTKENATRRIAFNVLFFFTSLAVALHRKNQIEYNIG